MLKSRHLKTSELNPSGGNTPENSIDDDALWQSFKTGNELAFSLLYNRHVQRLYNYGMHTCMDKELVKDCLQELFARLWDKRETLGVAGSVNYYLFKSYRRLLINRIVSKRKFSIPFQGQPESVFEFVPSIEEYMVEQETKAYQYERLRSSIQSLTKRQREAIFLKFFNELSYHEVASIMEMRVDSVYNLISKTIDILRSKLKEITFFALILGFS
jgi:RNA polymerase sigma factor (sigma-70 family)